MSRAQEAADRAASILRRNTEAPPRSTVPPRAKPVKMTVELSPEAYRQVKAFPELMGIPEATGKARIPSVEVFRALIEELTVNEDLREHVAKRIRDNVNN